MSATICSAMQNNVYNRLWYFYNDSNKYNKIFVYILSKWLCEKCKNLYKKFYYIMKIEKSIKKITILAKYVEYMNTIFVEYL